MGSGGPVSPKARRCGSGAGPADAARCAAPGEPSRPAAARCPGDSRGPGRLAGSASAGARAGAGPPSAPRGALAAASLLWRGGRHPGRRSGRGGPPPAAARPLPPPAPPRLSPGRGLGSPRSAPWPRACAASRAAASGCSWVSGAGVPDALAGRRAPRAPGARPANAPWAGGRRGGRGPRGAAPRPRDRRVGGLAGPVRGPPPRSSGPRAAPPAQGAPAAPPGTAPSARGWRGRGPRGAPGPRPFGQEALAAENLSLAGRRRVANAPPTPGVRGRGAGSRGTSPAPARALGRRVRLIETLSGTRGGGARGLRAGRSAD